MPPADRDEARGALIGACVAVQGYDRGPDDEVTPGVVVMRATRLANAILALAAPREPTAAAEGVIAVPTLPTNAADEALVDGLMRRAKSSGQEGMGPEPLRLFAWLTSTGAMGGYTRDVGVAESWRLSGECRVVELVDARALTASAAECERLTRERDASASGAVSMKAAAEQAWKERDLAIRDHALAATERDEWEGAALDARQQLGEREARVAELEGALERIARHGKEGVAEDGCLWCWEETVTAPQGTGYAPWRDRAHLPSCPVGAALSPAPAAPSPAPTCGTTGRWCCAKPGCEGEAMAREVYCAPCIATELAKQLTTERNRPMSDPKDNGNPSLPPISYELHEAIDRETQAAYSRGATSVWRSLGVADQMEDGGGKGLPNEAVYDEATKLYVVRPKMK